MPRTLSSGYLAPTLLKIPLFPVFTTLRCSHVASAVGWVLASSQMQGEILTPQGDGISRWGLLGDDEALRADGTLTERPPRAPDPLSLRTQAEADSVT